jgi:hypothetical protein
MKAHTKAGEKIKIKIYFIKREKERIVDALKAEHKRAEGQRPRKCREKYLTIYSSINQYA